MTRYENVGPCFVVRTSEKALLIRTGQDLEDLEEHWVPFSLVEPEDLAAVEEGTRAQSLRVEIWFVRKEGIA